MVKGTPKTPKTPRTTQTTPTPSRTPKRKETTNKQVAQEPPEEGAESTNKEDSVKRPRQATISTYFHRVDKPAPPPTVPPSILNTRFRPFQLKEGMRMAPVLVRKPLSDKDRDNLLTITEPFKYLAYCKTKRQKQAATNIDALKPKYYHFHDNYRPPYLGTWRRRSAQITGRRPFGQEETLNYEENSDDDWEEEPDDADECKSDEEDIEKDEDMDEEENDGFFVDHGYLSTDEGSDCANEDGDADDDSDGDKKQRKRNASAKDAEETEEQRRKRLAQKAQEWHESVRQKERRARKREELKPTLFMPMGVDVQHLSSSAAHMVHFCLPAIRFDYSKLVSVEEMDQTGEPGPSTAGAAAAAILSDDA
ncbi:hypothetical protein GPALN_004096 [Globodera pallida]|nr:hypothetical protein GPALN_004096 [Globodera pallida]